MIPYTRAIRVFLYFLLINVFNLSAYSQDDIVKLQLKWKHQFQFAGYYAAQIKNYYQEEGLNVIIQEHDGKQDVISDVVNNNVQYGVYGSDILLDYAKGKPVKVLASIFQHSPYAIISPEEKKITKPTDLSGKKIMAGRGMGAITLQALLHREGISLDSVEILPFNKNLLLKDKQIDAIIAYTSSTPFELSRAGIPPSVIQPSDYGVDFYGDILFTSQEEIDRHPERVERFLRASLKGWEYALQHPDEIADYILSLPGVKERNIDKEFLLEEARVINELIRPNLVEIGHTNKGRWEFIYSMYKELGVVKSNKNVKELLYFPTDVDKKYRKILICIIVLLVFFVLVFLLRNIVINKRLNLEKEKLQEVDIKSKFNEESIQIILEHAGIILWNWNVTNHRFSIYGNENLGNQIKNIEDFKLLIHTDTLNKFDLFLGLLPNDFSQEVLVKINNEYQWRLLTIKARSYENNMPVSYMGLLIDISDIKKKQAHLEKLSNELQKTNTELKKFAYITSHNLRAPVVNLESLISFYDYNAKDITDNNDIVTKMDISVQRLKRTLEDLVEVLSNKSEKIHLEYLNIEEEIFNLLEKLKISERKQNIRIITDLKNVTEIICSKNGFHTIFENLITNSIKFRKPEGQLIIKLRSFETEEYTVIEIEDNGMGINMEKNAEKIFGLYQKFQPGIEGRGIGLFIVKSQIEGLDGKIEVDSKIQEGTTFRIFFRKQVLK